MPKFGAENTLLEYFWAEVLKNYCKVLCKRKPF